MESQLNSQVRSFWEAVPCGTQTDITGTLKPLTPEWFEQVEEHRYAVEPFIHGVAQFTRHRGKMMLEVGVGAGTDHLQWARAGCECNGVDLTDAGIATTRARLALYGLSSNLQRINAEQLPFADDTFDLVYSWGVIHHSEKPEEIIAEIRRVLKPGGMFVGMFYNLHSVAVFKQWVRHGLMKGRPGRTWRDCTWHHIESIGTKAYTRDELRAMFGAFSGVQVWSLQTPYDKSRFPAVVARFFPDDWGFFTAVRATK